MIKILFLLFSTQVFSAEYVQACFNKKSVLIKAFEETKFVLTNSDKSRVNNQCIDFFIDHSRLKLLKKYLNQNYRGHYSLDRESDKIEECKLTLEKKTKLNQASNQYRVGSQIKLRDTNKTGESKSSQYLLIQSGKTLTTKIGDDEVLLRCTVREGYYNIFIHTKNKKINIQTSFTLKHGAVRELAQFTKNIKDKKNKLGLSIGVAASGNNSQETTIFSLKSNN